MKIKISDIAKKAGVSEYILQIYSLFSLLIPLRLLMKKENIFYK